MNEEFDTKNYIKVTDLRGKDYFLPKDLLASVKPTNAGSLIQLKGEDGRILPGALPVKEDAKSIVAAINGELSKGELDQLRTSIVTARRETAEQSLEALRNNRGSQLRSVWQSHESAQTETMIGRLGEAFKANYIASRINRSARLRVANIFAEASDRPWMPAFARNAADAVMRGIAGRKSGWFDALRAAEQAIRRADIYKAEQKDAHVLDLGRRDFEFRNSRQRLEIEARDPNWRAEDEAALQARRAAFQQENARDDVRFVFDPASGSFRNSADLGLERQGPRYAPRPR